MPEGLSVAPQHPRRSCVWWHMYITLIQGTQIDVGILEPVNLTKSGNIRFCNSVSKTKAEMIKARHTSVYDMGRGVCWGEGRY